MRWLPLLLFLLQMPLYADYLTDDSYIYAQFARNLAQHGELAFNPGEPAHAATSPLWAAWGAVAELLGWPAFWWLKVSGILCGALAVFVFTSALRAVLPHGVAMWGGLAFAAQPWFVRWSASGMETALASLVATLLLWSLGAARSAKSDRCVALVAGVGPLVRPEFLLLSVLLGLAALADQRLRRSASFFGLLAAPMLLWWGITAGMGLSALPTTMFAKSTGGAVDWGRMVANLGLMVRITAVAAVGPGLLWLLALWRGRRGGFAGWGRFALWAWLVLLPAIYVLRDVTIVSRYLEIWIPFLLFAAWRAAADAPRLLRAVIAAHIVFCLVLSVFWISPSTRAFSRSIKPAMTEIADWLRANTPPDTQVAAYDIGLLGYFSERRIQDLGGLIDPQIARLRRFVDDEEIVASGRFLEFGVPDLLLHRAAVPEALVGRDWNGIRPQPVLSRTVANLGLSQADAVVYTLYRLVAAEN